MKYEFIGWCRDEEKNQDKIWTVIDLSEGTLNWVVNRPYATVWGRRGKKLQHKIVHASAYDMSRLIDRKMDKGYKKVLKFELDNVYPEFEQDLEQTAVWALLMV
jgi:predicted DNA-binding WGR domain protein